MLLSLSLILLAGLLFSSVFSKMHIPGLIGMILTGIILGPHVLNYISPEILNISSDLREIALIVILMRAGLALDISDLKKVGRPAILMCFIPATIELISIVIFAPIIIGISYLDAAILGTVVAAVSPAVTVPRMIKLIDEGYGKDKSIPQLIMAGASADDIYVIILFSSFISMYSGSDFHLITLVKVPLSIALGLILGISVGLILVQFFKKIHMKDTVKVIILICVSFLFVSLENFLKPSLEISGLLAVMALGCTILKSYEILAKRLLSKFSKIWVGAEIILFVLVGAAVNINTLANASFGLIAIVIIAVIFRTIGVNLSLIKTQLNIKERLFCSIAYLPKATVQAAIGAIPISVGVISGDIMLTIAVLSIIMTAPVGAIGVDLLHKRLLTKSNV